MTYIGQKEKKVIAENLKKVLKGSGLKYSLRIRNHMALVMTITQGPIDFFGDLVIADYDPFANFPAGQAAEQKRAEMRQRGSLDVNVYHIPRHYTGKSKTILLKILDTLKSAGWYDRSDAMIDYFDTAYYIDINVGKWDKPYQLMR